MERYIITGGKELHGSYTLPSAKNSVLPIMAASLLCRTDVVLASCPRISDVCVSMDILRALGCEAVLQDGAMRISSALLHRGDIPQALMSAMRSSVFYIAPLLVRLGSVRFFVPGGCRLGARPIDIHLDGLMHMGAKLIYEGEQIQITAPHGLRGVDYTLRLPSVGATETLMMAAAGASSNSVLRGVASEPEVCDLARFLTSCGSKITGAGSGVIHIHPQGELAQTNGAYSMNKDRITAATVLFAAACTRGDVTIEGGDTGQYSATLKVLKDMGCKLNIKSDSVRLCSERRLSAQRLLADVYPYFCTDSSPLAAAALLTAEGDSVVTDAIFENRFACADGFEAMGAKVSRVGRALHIRGTELKAASLTAPDLRGGAALAIAALCAEGKSELYGLEHIRRGYEDLSEVFSGLGAHIALCQNVN